MYCDRFVIDLKFKKGVQQEMFGTDRKKGNWTV